MRLFSTIFVIMALGLPTQVVSSEFLSIKYSKKNQVRTGMRWMQHHPNLVRSEDMTPILHRIQRGEDDVIPDEYAFTPNITVPDPADLNQLPHAAIGKLFFTKKSGPVSTCSAGFAGGSDIIVTAAHCILSLSGEWNDDFLFVRAYGTNHQEAYGIACVGVPWQWGELEGDDALDYDFAFLKTIRDSSEGALGVSNGLAPEEVLLVGYANKYFNGRVMLNLTSPAFYSPNGRVSSKDNPLGRGSSGTPWVGTSTVYSLSSYFLEDEDDVMWGPRFTRETMELMNYVRNGCQG